MLPLAFVWTFGVCRARALLRRSRRLARPGEYWNAIRGPLYVAKMSVALAMTALFAVWTSGVNDFSTIGAEVLFTRAALVTQFVVLFLVHLEHRFHRVSSSVLVVYWLLLLAAAGVRLQSLVVEHHDAEPQVPLLATVIALALCSIALEHMDKNRAGYVRPGESLNPCPETRAHFFSMISFSWLNGIMRLGYGKPLVEEDLWDVKAEDDARFVSDEFQREWGSEMMGGRYSGTLRIR